MSDVMRALGFMSGTSMDGADSALIETDGENELRILAGKYQAYDGAVRDIVGRAVAEAVSLKDRDARPGALGEAERVLTDCHLSLAQAILSEHGLTAQDLDVVGFHGQTVLHRPDERLTIQLGDGQRLASELGAQVVFDLRAADVAVGGQGAPFVPIYHRALVAKSDVELPAMVVNIGGVGNITYVGSGRNEDLVAFDTGPGNALIDDWLQLCGAGAFDEGGRLGLSGRVNEEALTALLHNPYFSTYPPKSLDRNDFCLDEVKGLSVEDGAATLARFTAATIAASAQFVEAGPKNWIICGGGAQNGAIMLGLDELVSGRVVAASDIGWNGDFIEAEAFAYLAVRSVKGLPLTYPGTTGVPTAQKGGRLVMPGA